MRKLLLSLISIFYKKPVKTPEPKILKTPHESEGFRKALIRISQMWCADILVDGDVLYRINPKKYIDITISPGNIKAVFCEDFSQKRIGDNFQLGIVRIVYSLKDRKWEVRIGEMKRVAGLVPESEIERFIMNLWYKNQILTVQDVK